MLWDGSKENLQGGNSVKDVFEHKKVTRKISEIEFLYTMCLG